MWTVLDDHHWICIWFFFVYIGQEKFQIIEKSDIVVDRIGETAQLVVQIEGQVADDDTTELRCFKFIAHAIQKMSENRHVKFSWSSSKWKVETFLSSKLIKYIHKRFNYTISQNQRNLPLLWSALEKWSVTARFRNYLQ